MKKCILIYDDDPGILEVCTLILERRNYHTASRLICDNIIEDIHQEKPDLVLMDLWIPEIGGEHAIQLMKENPETQFIPVILFSAHNEIEEVYKRSMANAFIKKPFKLMDLVSLIERI